MKNKFRIGEIVVVNGKGKIFEKNESGLAIIESKDYYFNEYLVTILSKHKQDWFKEKAIERILGNKRNLVERYQIRLCTTEQGYELIKKEINKNLPLNNNKFRKVKIYRKFQKDNIIYIAMGWNSVFWPVSNKSIQIINNTIRSFKRLDIPFQYIVMNEDDLTDIEVYEFIENDSNVKIFSIERKIKIKI